MGADPVEVGGSRPEVPLPRDADAAVTGPLAATLARLDAADEGCSYVAGDPEDANGAGWCRLDEALHGGSILDQWYWAIVEGEAEGLRNVAGALLASYVTDVIAQTAVKALTTEGRVWPLDAEVLALRRHPNGWFDGIAVRTRRVRVLPGDLDAGNPDAEVVDDDVALREILAAELVAVATPIFAAVRRRAPFGLPGMWGNLIDGIAAGAVWQSWPPRARGDIRAPYAIALKVIDEMAVRVPLIRARPRLERVDWSGGTAWMVAKTACCLLYKTYEGPRVQTCCAPCPLRDDESGRAQWAAWLDEQAMAEKGAA